jgi:hypothetical protein
MVDSPNTHWTTDEHLLAQYILGQLDARQAAELEKHLRDCPQCRGAVAAEQQLAAGVRRAGRDELKQRLAQRLGQKRSGTNWYRVAGVAAAFVVLLTVGIYNKWFFSGEPRLADSSLKSDSVTQKTEPSPRQPAPGEQSHEKMQLADVSKPSATDRDRAESKGAGVRGAELDKKKGDERREKRGAVNVPVPEKSGDILSKKDQVMAAAEAEGIWVEGTVVSEDANARAAGQAMDKRTEDVRENAPKGKKEPAALMSLAAGSRSLQTEGQAVMVTQRPMSDLPRNQISGKQNLSQVQTLLRSDAGGLSMVLYSDSLLNRNDLGQARLQTIREDSIILRIGSQRIGYRLPSGLSEQMARQLKKAP